MARQGITEIHDITEDPYPQYYATLQENGELTARIWMRLDLSRSSEIAQSERERLSHSFKTFLDNGVVTVGGSDIPGAQGATFKNHPRAIFNALVNRTRNDGTPEGGWLPEERITTHNAIKMYTLDAAYSVFDEDVRGSIKVGKLADLTVTDLNLIEIDPTDVLKMNVVMTVVDGRVVFEQENQ